jgi:hypothetical protein
VLWCYSQIRHSATLLLLQETEITDTKNVVAVSLTRIVALEVRAVGCRLCGTTLPLCIALLAGYGRPDAQRVRVYI